MNAQQLYDKFRRMPNTPVPPYHTWERHRYELRQHILRGDDISDFTNWSTVQATMFVGEAPYIVNEYLSLCDEWPECLPAIAEGVTGNPKRLSFAPETSGNMVHQAYHLLQLRRTGLDINSMRSIVEFGGGYGAMARLCRKLGYRGKYYIHDLPEFSYLQQYYLEQEGIDFIPGFCENADLLIACYSLSEVSEDTRLQFMSVVNPRCVLISYADVYGDFVPVKEIPAMLTRMDYIYASSPANPPGHNYSVGEKQ